MRLVLVLISALAWPAAAQQLPFAEGDQVAFDQLERLREFLPPDVWRQRQLLFEEDSRLRIGTLEAADTTPVDCTRESPVAEEPLDARGSIVITYRTESADEKRKEPDTWVFLPARRGVRQLEANQTDPTQADSVARGELRGIQAIPPTGNASCGDAVRVLAPSDDSGAWRLHDAWRLRFDTDEGGHEEVWVDRHTFQPLYAFFYDRRQELWKITWQPNGGREVTIDVQARRKLSDLER